MTQVHNFITVTTSGYGHKKVTAYLLNGEKPYTITNNMPLIDKYNSDDDSEMEEAKKRLIEMVLSDNGIEEFEING